MSAIDDGDLQDLLKENWSALCSFGYGQYINNGRGIVGIERTEDAATGEHAHEILYVVFDHEAGEPDAETADMLASYEPEKEILLQYARSDGSVRTMRLRASPGRACPEEAWVDQVLDDASRADADPPEG